jgi:hypothetical protein
MPKTPKVIKESSNREREEGKTSEKGTNPFRRSSRTGKSPSRSEEGNKSKEMDKEIKTMVREIKEDTAELREKKNGMHRRQFR